MYFVILQTDQTVKDQFLDNICIKHGWNANFPLYMDRVVQLYKGDSSLNIHGPSKVSNWESGKLDPTWDNGYWKKRSKKSCFGN